MSHQFEKLEIWNRSVTLATEIYLATKDFPKEETYGLVDQIRRCSVSIPSNIAEGAGRDTNKQFSYFLSISKGSIYELQTQLTIALNLNYISEGEYSKIKDELIAISFMLHKFKQKILK